MLDSQITSKTCIKLLMKFFINSNTTIFVGSDFDEAYLNLLAKKTEANVSFKIRYITVEPDELPQYIQDKTKSLLVWSAI